MTVGDVTQVAAAVAAAGAAGAAWRTARSAERTLRNASEPRLVVQVLNVNGQAHVEVQNVGGGAALGCAFVVVASGSRASGPVLEGMLVPGDRARIRTTMRVSPTSEVLGVVVARDADGAVTGWDMGSRRHRQFKRGADGRPPTLTQVFAALAPDVDLAPLHPSPSDVLRGSELQARRDLTFRPTSAQILNPLAA